MKKLLTLFALGLSNVGFAQSPQYLAVPGATSTGTGTNNVIKFPGALYAPNVGGTFYASQYAGQTNTGIMSTFTDNVRCGASGSGGVGGCTVIADPTYPVTEQPYVFTLFGYSKYPSAPMSHLVDQRKGYELNLFHNPQWNRFTLANDYLVDACIGTVLQGINGGSAGWTGTKQTCHSVNYNISSPGIDLGTTAGNNGEHGPGGWSVQAGLSVGGVVNSPGISEAVGATQIKAGIGDTTGYYFYNYNYGGSVAGSDEGNHIGALGGGEQRTTYVGTITTGGAKVTNVKVNCTADCPYPGDGRFLVDTTAGVTGNVSVATYAGLLTFTVDISVPVSTAWGMLAADVKTPTSGAPKGAATTDMTFSVNSSNGNSGQFAVNDLVCFNGSFHEQARIKTVSGTGPWTLTVPLRHSHSGGSLIMANGTCGSFISFTANEMPIGSQIIRYPSDIIGSTDAHTLVYAYFVTGGSNDFGHMYGNVRIASLGSSGFGGISNKGGAVTVGNVNIWNAAYLYNVPVITISGAANPLFNGKCNNTRPTASGALQCDQAASTGQTNTGNAIVALGTSPYGNTSFHLYPGAEVIDVLNYNAANR